MQNLLAKTVLVINLTKQEYEVKSFPELGKYIGGLGMGLKLLQNYFAKDALVFAVGPLNGYFPFCSKTAVIFNDDGVVEDLYVGGSLSLRIKYSSIDAIVITGKSQEPITLDILNGTVNFKSADTKASSLGLPGKRSVLEFTEHKFLVDHYFSTPETMLETKVKSKNILGMAISGTESFTVPNFSEYNALYKELLARTPEITIAKNSFPSCSGCPMGCDKSKFGELGGNVLLHSLCACQYASKIYSDVGIVFSCLSILGYHYTHEDIEALPVYIEQTLKELSNL